MCSQSCSEKKCNIYCSGHCTFAAIIVTGGYPYDIGKTAEVLFPNGTSWKTLPDMNTYRWFHAQAGRTACGGIL